LQRIIRKKGGDTEKMSENLTDKPEKIATEPEKIGSTTEKIDKNSEKITSDTEKIPEIIRYRGQRGPDKTPRIFNANSLSNLKQYQNIHVPKLNSDKWIWIVIGILAGILAIILIWKIYEWRKEKRVSTKL